MTQPAEPILSTRDLSVQFPVRGGLLRGIRGYVKAVDRVSLDIQRGETLGLVGESGSGKTTLGRAVLRLLPSDAHVAGSVTFDGMEVSGLDRTSLRRLRRRMQMVFQDPYGSLNPRMKVSTILSDPLSIHGISSRSDRNERVLNLLRLVGLDVASASRYPHAFSGGQRQRVAIARALAVDPDFVVCDEPVTALDVSIQGQILNVLSDLQSRLGLTYLFIAHDLSVVRHMSDRLGVMYLGALVELGDAERTYQQPAHPYTRALLSAIPEPDPEREQARRRIILRGDIPSPSSPPAGCRFHTRCWLYQRLGEPEDCRLDPPQLRPAPNGGVASCHHIEEMSGALRPEELA